MAKLSAAHRDVKEYPYPILFKAQIEAALVWFVAHSHGVAKRGLLADQK